MDKIFEMQAKDILTLLDPEGRRKKREPRPFMVELFGTSNSGKTTLLDNIYVPFKVTGYEVAKSPEGAEAVPPPRVLPIFNFMTADYAINQARRMSLDKNIHLALFDRAIYDAAVRMELFRRQKLITRADRKILEAYYLNRWNRQLFDLHICLVTDVETALCRKYGPDHVKDAKYSTTTNPETMAEMLSAHKDLWERLWKEDPKMLWHDTSAETPEETVRALLPLILDAFRKRFAIKEA